jgi:starch synthase
MRILIACSEAVPYAKTGGLADVTGAILREFRKKSENASIILPLYSVIKKKFNLFRTGRSIRVTMGNITLKGEIFISERSSRPSAYFIDCDKLYGRPELYGTSDSDYPDNALRFIFFSMAVFETCNVMKIKPDVIHCNDWQTAMIPLYLKTLYKGNDYLENTATLYTVHNLGYEGLFTASDLKYTGLGWDYFTPERLEFYGRLNFMKAGLLYSDLINSVSETYAKEILKKENGFGLDGVLRKRQSDLYGIINGVDYNEWDPAKDSLIPERYDIDNMKGKAGNKNELLKITGLNSNNLPLMGLVGRLSSQKGLELLYNSLDELSNMGVNVILLGKGDDYYQNLFLAASEKYRGRVFFKIGFDEALAHLIYAGCDFFLMPSRYEPCGLGQLIAMKYGTIPIARRTGGLADSIQDYNHILSKGTGFLFSDYTPSAMQDAVKRALCVFTDNERMKKIIINAMKSDFSWKSSADKYLELYRKAIKKVRI